MTRQCYALAAKLFLSVLRKTPSAIPGSSGIASRSPRSIAPVRSSSPDSSTHIHIPFLLVLALSTSRSGLKAPLTSRLLPQEAESGPASKVSDVLPKLLRAKVLKVFHDMAAHGTTTVEAKSGYGLTLESEFKSLEAIREAASSWPGTVISTLLGAHVVPKEFQGCSQNYVEIVCKEMIPRAARRKLAQFVDVFCDKGAFTPEETEQIFAAAQKHGLPARAIWASFRRQLWGHSCVSIRHRSITWTT